MTQTKIKKQVRKKTRKPRRRFPQLPLRALVYASLLLSLLLVSIGVLGYFIFLRTVVVAAESNVDGGTGVVFEEPSLPEYSDNREFSSNRGGSPRCAIIIDDMGYHREVGEALIHLPLSLTFSFLPRAPFTKELEQLAYEKGRTILLHLPLEPKEERWDAGPGALYLGDRENQRALFLSNLEKVPHATGVNNHMGSRYSENREAMWLLLALIAEKKLYFIDSLTSAGSVGMVVAEELGLARSQRDIFLDNVPEVEAICAKVSELVMLAVKKGSAIGIAHPNRETLNALIQCGDLLQSQVELVGVDALLQQ